MPPVASRRRGPDTEIRSRGFQFRVRHAPIPSRRATIAFVCDSPPASVLGRSVGQKARQTASLRQRGLWNRLVALVVLKKRPDEARHIWFWLLRTSNRPRDGWLRFLELDRLIIFGGFPPGQDRLPTIHDRIADDIRRGLGRAVHRVPARRSWRLPSNRDQRGA